jgi:hypothetical protein
MLILLNELDLLEKTKIYATDINTDVIETAKLGEYKYRFNLSYLDNFDKVVKENPYNYEKRVDEIFPFIKESQSYADFAYGKSTIYNHTFYLILLGLMSGLINPEKKEIGKYAKKGYEYLKEYIIKNGGIIEN